MADKVWSYLNLATGYPSNDALLKQEFDKILQEPERRQNIRKALKYISAFAGPQKARPTAKRKTRNTSTARKRKRTVSK